LNSFLEISGIIFWLSLIVITIYFLVYGKKYLINIGIHVLSLSKFNDSLKNLFKQLPDKVKQETISEVIGTLIWRMTRIGFLVVFLSSIPIILLYQQNKLIESQNSLFTEQNLMIESQSNLFSDQNLLIKNQLRPYITLSTPGNDISLTHISVSNSPAYVDSLIIEFYIKDFGNNPFVLIDQQIDTDLTLYPTTNKSVKRIQTNILTPEFKEDLKAKNKRLMRKTRIVYSNLNDEIGKESVGGKFELERVDFLSKINNRWYTKSEND